MTFHKNGVRDVANNTESTREIFIMLINTIEWKISNGLMPYLSAIAEMEQRVEDIIAGNAPEMVWLVEHPPLYTAGTSANEADLLSSEFPLYHTGRGGQITYHGPGQRVAYVMLNLKKRNAMDVRAFVQHLENWLIVTLAEFGVNGEIREGRVGVWVNTQTVEAKIAALGIRVRKWVTFHGISLNINPDLSHYAGIVPCGIRGFGITSLKALGIPATMNEIDAVLEREFRKIF
jgi:lipoyl(octanoyl) transferase